MNEREALLDYLVELLDSDDREKAAAIFADQVRLAKMTEDEAAEAERERHRKAVRWIASPATKEGSFRWACDEFSLDVDAVRRAIAARVK